MQSAHCSRSSTALQLISAILKCYILVVLRSIYICLFIYLFNKSSCSTRLQPYTREVCRVHFVPKTFQAACYFYLTIFLYINLWLCIRLVYNVLTGLIMIMFRGRDRFQKFVKDCMGFSHALEIRLLMVCTQADNGYLRTR